MTTSCARTHFAAHSPKVSHGMVNVHLEVVGAAAADAAGIVIEIAVGSAETLVCEDC